MRHISILWTWVWMNCNYGERMGEIIKIDNNEIENVSSGNLGGNLE